MSVRQWIWKSFQSKFKALVPLSSHLSSWLGVPPTLSWPPEDEPAVELREFWPYKKQILPVAPIVEVLVEGWAGAEIPPGAI